MLPFLSNDTKEKITTVLGILLALYILYTTIWGYRVMMVHRSFFLAVMLVMYFSSIKPLGERLYAKLIDSFFVIATLLSLGYVFFFYERILYAAGGARFENWEVGLGILLILVVMEATRRASMPFFVIVVVSVLYTLFGNYLPGILQHPGLQLHRMVYLTAFTSEGIFGVGVAVASGILYMFILFGSVMDTTGVGDFFIRFANSLVGGLRGGSAKTSLIASSLIGSVMGNSTANVVVTGSFTIPLMIKTGFKKKVAAAIECLASEGGQYLPPIMGASAFLMAQLTQIPYTEVVVAAIIPAVLYYFYSFVLVDIEAAKNGLRGLSKEERGSFSDVFKKEGHKLLPLLVAFYTIIVIRMTPMYAGMLAIFTTLLVTQFRLPWKDKVTNTLQSFDKGSRNVGNLIGLVAGIGLVQQAFVITGLGARLTGILIQTAGGNVFLLLLMGLALCILLGMGMPTPIAYLLVALFVAPAIVEVGIPLLAAHLFLLYGAVKAGSTPPIAVVAMVAAGVAKSEFWPTAWKAFSFSVPTFLLAFAFIYYPELLLLQGGPLDIAYRAIITLASLIGFTWAIQGYMFRKVNILERFLLGGASVLILLDNYYAFFGGFLIIIVIAMREIAYKLYIERNKKHATH